MIAFKISRDVAATLKAKGYPFPVLYGPEFNRPTTINSTRIVFERDRSAGDQIAPVRSQHVNPRYVSMTAVGIRVLIYAQHTALSAGVQDHEGLADQLRRAVRVALAEVIGRRKTHWLTASQKFLSKEELELRDLLQWPGVVYQILIYVEDGDADVNFDGEAKPEAELGGPDGVAIESTTEVNLPGSSADSETACGG